MLWNINAILITKMYLKDVYSNDQMLHKTVSTTLMTVINAIELLSNKPDGLLVKVRDRK